MKKLIVLTIIGLFLGVAVAPNVVLASDDEHLVFTAFIIGKIKNPYYQQGYYYIQELASMLPIIVLKPGENDLILDLCSAPGSKTTQTAALMENTGTIIANEVSLPRIKVLASNLERCGVTNTIITKKEGVAFDDEEFYKGVRGVAAGVKDADGKLVGALSIVAPKVRLTHARMRGLTTDVKNCALEISRELGYKD